MLGGLSETRDIVIRALMAKATEDALCERRADPAYEVMRQELCNDKAGVTYEAASDFTNRAPIILVTVDADSATNAVIALNAVMERVPKVLADLQEGLRLKPNAEITSTVLVADNKPDVVRKSQIRAGIVAGAGTLGASLLMIGLFDGLRASRRPGKARNERDEVISHWEWQPSPDAHSDWSDSATPMSKDRIPAGVGQHDAASGVAAASGPQVGQDAASAAASEPQVGQDAASAAASEPQVGQDAAPEAASEPQVGQDAAPEAASEPQVGQDAAPEAASGPEVGQDAAPEAEAEWRLPPWFEPGLVLSVNSAEHGDGVESTPLLTQTNAALNGRRTSASQR
jgi:hypothetical protein